MRDAGSHVVHGFVSACKPSLSPSDWPEVAYCRRNAGSDNAVYRTSLMPGWNIVVLALCPDCGTWTGWWVAAAPTADGANELVRAINSMRAPAVVVCCGRRFPATMMTWVVDGKIEWDRAVPLDWLDSVEWAPTA